MALEPPHRSALVPPYERFQNSCPVCPGVHEAVSTRSLRLALQGVASTVTEFDTMRMPAA
jgi:hypothetical protein